LAFLTFFGTLAPFSRKLLVRISPNFYHWSKMQITSKLGVWGSLGISHLRGPHPDLTGPSYSPGGPEKNSFYSEGIDPHLGEIWNFEIFKITVFEPILAMSLQRTRYDTNFHVPSRRTDRMYSGRPSICGAPPRLRTRRV